MPSYTPTSQITAYPNDQSYQIVFIAPTTPGGVTIDISNLLATGDSVVSGPWVTNGSHGSQVTITGSSVAPTSSTAFFAHTMLLGQNALLSCMFTSALGMQITRSVRLVVEEL